MVRRGRARCDAEGPNQPEEARPRRGDPPALCRPVPQRCSAPRACVATVVATYGHHVLRRRSGSRSQRGRCADDAKAPRRGRLPGASAPWMAPSQATWTYSCRSWKTSPVRCPTIPDQEASPVRCRTIPDLGSITGAASDHVEQGEGSCPTAGAGGCPVPGRRRSRWHRWRW